MTAKSAVAVVLGVLCFAPVALVARHEQVRLHAFTTEAAASKIGRGVVAAMPSEPRTVQLGSVEIFATRTPRSSPASVDPASCDHWRTLAVGARARSATTTWVRACDGPPDAERQPPAAVPAKPVTRDVPATRPLEWVVDLAAPQ